MVPTTVGYCLGKTDFPTHASSLAQRVAFAESYGERFLLSPLQPDLLWTFFFAGDGYEPSFSLRPTA